MPLAPDRVGVRVGAVWRGVTDGTHRTLQTTVRPLCVVRMSAGLLLDEQWSNVV
jgi:hypothetical protein